jgi:hypothetical protein
MKFVLAGKTEEITFSLSIDDDGDVVVSADNGLFREELLYISSTTGNIHRYHGISEAYGFDLDENERLIVSE